MICGEASAQVSTCVPYTIPIQSTVTACGQGLMGSKYKTSTMACPSGVVTTSTNYDTSGCVTAPSSSGTILTGAARCALTPDACGSTPSPQNCPTGRHWSLLGSNVAHCVQDDPTCPWGTSLKHDSLGNPSCVANTCPSNQVLQGDGVSCACGSGLVWNGSSCAVPPPSCTASDNVTSSQACTSGSGTQYYHKSTTCPGGAYGSPSVSYYWDTSSCVAPPPVTCTASSYTNSQACSSGSGTQSQTVTTSCPGGSYGSPSTSYGAWNTSGCSSPPPPCTQTTSTTYQACGSGYTGNIAITTTYLCPSGTSQSQNTGGCGCANGAPDYPTCTIYTPPPPASNICPQNGKSYDVCTASGPLPNRGQHQSIYYQDDGTNTGTCTKTIDRLGNCGYNPSYWFIDF